MNNFISVDFQTHVSIWFLISMKFCTRIINKKRGVRKCNSAELSNSLREDTPTGNAGDRALCSNCWMARGTLLQSTLDNWPVFQELWIDILEGKVDLEIWGQVICVQMQKQNLALISFFDTTGSCFDAYRQFIYFSTINASHVIKVSKLQKYVFQHRKVWEWKLVSICFWKRWPKTT